MTRNHTKKVIYGGITQLLELAKLYYLLLTYNFLPALFLCFLTLRSITRLGLSDLSLAFLTTFLFLKILANVNALISRML